MFEWFSPKTLVYIALLFQVMGFLARDELWLRLLVLFGSAFFIMYYIYISEDALKLVDAVVVSGTLALTNLAMIIVLIFERTTFAMSDEMSKIYRNFPTLNPGQFRKIMKLGVVREEEPGKILAKDGEALRDLILLIDGKLKITKGANVYQCGSGIFIGEISFLLGGKASATVAISEPSKYVEWKHEDLRRLMQKSEALNNALIALFGAELAGKMENAVMMDALAKS